MDVRKLASAAQPAFFAIQQFWIGLKCDVHRLIASAPVLSEVDPTIAQYGCAGPNTLPRLRAWSAGELFNGAKGWSDVRAMQTVQHFNTCGCAPVLIQTRNGLALPLAVSAAGGLSNRNVTLPFLNAAIPACGAEAFRGGEASRLTTAVANVLLQLVQRVGLRAAQGLSGLMHVCKVQVDEIDKGVEMLGTGFGNAFAAIDAAAFESPGGVAAHLVCAACAHTDKNRYKRVRFYTKKRARSCFSALRSLKKCK